MRMCGYYVFLITKEKRKVLVGTRKWMKADENCVFQPRSRNTQLGFYCTFVFFSCLQNS